MTNLVKLDELQGLYEITYASTPPLEHFYEAGFGSAKIEGNNLTGVDALGVVWNAEFDILDSGKISFNALLDPSTAPSNVGLMDNKGIMTRDPQRYKGIINVTKSGSLIILRTQVKQGPLTIDVQFKKQS